jgi:ribonucleoside-diphosphate reductase alpha chain
VNLARHVVDGRLDEAALARTVETAIRMLDNVVDINFYPTPEARASNLRHRPIGLGIMGFQDALFLLDLPFDSAGAVDLADRTMELVSQHAILASSRLAKERGAYESYRGSKWDRGIFPLDTLDLLERERGLPIDVPRTSRLDWAPVREHVRQHGMRNSNTMAIAPTATIANIAGCFPCIEPIYKNIYVKANISGEFTIVNEYLVRDLKSLGLWTEETLDQLKYFDGNLQMIAGIPEPLKEKYREAFEIDPVGALQLTAARGKWIDQSQSHNVFMKGVSGRKLSDIYLTAWRLGLKTTYYLRTLAASQIEKSTLDAAKFGFTQTREYAAPAAAPGAIAEPAPAAVAAGPLCTIDDPDCEACQ